MGNAIVDYILFGRPDTTLPNLFVCHKRPYDKLNYSAGQEAILRHLNKAGISHEAWDGKTFHALRRTAGTRLVRAGIPIQSVSEMLGQLNPDSAKGYIALDNEGLRACCLGISGYTCRKGGLV